MDQNRMLDQLEELARSLEIEIRYEPLKKTGSYTAGGLCRLKEEWIIILHSKASIQEKIETLATSLRQFDIGEIYLRPGLREFLEKFPKSGLKTKLIW